MPRILRSEMNATGKRFAVVASEFNEDIVKRLADGAVAKLIEHGAKDEDIDVVWVPGAFEIPVAAKVLASKRQHDAIVCVGCVIRGETLHHLYVNQAAASGIAEVARESGVPCSFGVITAENRCQAEERSGKSENRGAEAAEAAVQMANLLPRLK